MGAISILTIIFIIQSTNGIVVYKQTKYEAAPNSRVEISNSSIHEYDQFTLCGRFWSPFNGSMPNIYLGLVYKPSYWIFSRLDFRDCEDWYAGCTGHFRKKIPNGWTPGTWIGTHYFNTADYFFENWKPEMWNAFCVVGDAANKTLLITINGISVFEADFYEGRHKLKPGNVNLLNAFTYKVQDYIYPFRGSITDVNIWSRSLDPDEVVAWSRCRSNLRGNLVDWNTASMTTIGDIETDHIDPEETCDFSKEDQFLAFEQNLNFPGMIKFCESLGGEVAVADDLEELKEMKQSLQSLLDTGSCNSVVYGGFINKNDNFRNPFTEVALTWTTVEYKVNYNSCVTIDMNKDFEAEKASFKGENCVFESCPICYFQRWPSELQIKGIPSSCNLDSFFYLPTATSLVGQHGESNIFYSESDLNWNIINKYDQQVGSNSKKFLDSGIQNWSFNCSDPLVTQLNLHKKVKQPGRDFKNFPVFKRFKFCLKDSSVVMMVLASHQTLCVMDTSSAMIKVMRRIVQEFCLRRTTTKTFLQKAEVGTSLKMNKLL